MRRSLLLATLVLSGGFLAAAPVGLSEALPAGVPWWPEDVDFPSELDQGWNLRIPLRLTNPGPDTKPAGLPVQIHLNLGLEMIEAGWPSSSASGGTVPSSFRADLDSVVLVEYADAWTRVMDPVPVVVHDRWLVQDQRARYNLDANEPFHETRNPVVTLEWTTTRPLVPQTQFLYFAYFEILENSDKAPITFEPHQLEPLNQMYWIGRGTVVYGQYTGAPSQVPTIQIIGTEPDTSVQVLTYRGGPIATIDNRPNSGNPQQPMSLGPGEVIRYSLGVSATNFRVDATKPVIVLWHPTSSLGGAFAPSLDQGLRGTSFLLPEMTDYFVVYAPRDVDSTRTNLRFGLQGEPLTDFQVQRGTWIALSRQDADDSSSPMDPTRLYVLQSDEPILVQYSISSTTNVGRQVPSLLGAALGTEHQSISLGHYAAAAWMDPVHVRAFERTAFDERDEIDPPVRIVPTSFQQITGAFRSAPFDPPNPPRYPYIVGAKSIDPVPSNERGLLQVLTSSGGSVDPVGGRHGLQFLATGAMVVFAHYDQTHVTFSPQGGTPTEVDLDEGTPFEYSSSGATMVSSDKPIAVIPKLTTGQSRFHPSLPGFVTPDVLQAEYRGYLVELVPRAGTDPSFHNVLPRQTLRVPFDAHNLGRDSNGQPLADVVTFSTEVNPPSFTGRISFRHPTLAFVDEHRVASAMEVTIPEDSPPNSVVSITVTATSNGNPNMKSSFTAILFTRQTFGIEMWFGEPTSPSGDRTTTGRFQPGEIREFPFVARNTGSGSDRFDLGLGALSGGWEATLVDGNRAISSTDDIPPGQQRGYVLRVRAPEVAEVAAITISLDGTSQASATAVDRILLGARLALEQDISLESAELEREVQPGKSTVFHVDAVNSGRDAVSVLFDFAGTLPDGWEVSFAGTGDPRDGPIALLPGQRVTIPIRLQAPSDAQARDLGLFLLEAQGVGDASTVRDAIGLAGIAAAVHRLVAEPPSPQIAPPASELNLTFRIRNGGNLDEEVSLVPIVLPGGWNATLPAPVVLSRDSGARPVSALVQVPADAPAQELVLQFGLRASNGAIVPANVSVNVPPVYDLGSSDIPPVRMKPLDSHRLFVRLYNDGNTADSLRLSASSEAGWPAEITPSVLEIPSRSSGLVELSWVVPADAAAGPTAIQLRAVSTAGGHAHEATVPVIIDNPSVELSNLIQPSDPVRIGDVLFVTALFRNSAGVPAHNVTARLLVGQAVVDEVTFGAIGPNHTVATLLRWVVDRAGEPVRLEWGTAAADHAFKPIGSRDLETEAPVDSIEEGAFLPGSPALLVLAIFVASAVAASRRRTTR